MAEMPSMAPVHEAFFKSRLSKVSTRVRLSFDADGKVTDAKVDPTTGDRNLNRAIAQWALKLPLKPGTAGTGFLPIAIDKTSR